MLKFITGRGNQRENQNKADGGDVGGETGCATAADYMDLQALPEGCIATVVSLTTPRDACRLSLVSRTFRSAGESDAVWDRFLPPETPKILAQSSQPQPALPPPPTSAYKSKKELYLSLCGKPVLIEHGKMSFSLDKWSGKKCYMVSAKGLQIVWADTPHYWRWIPLAESRFEEVAELLSVCWLDIRGKIDTRLLSPSTLYEAYLVFKSTPGAYGFEFQHVEGTVGLVGGEEPAKKTLFLDARRGQAQGYNVGPRRIRRFNRRLRLGLQSSQPREVDEAQYPKERGDGWLEIELGEFFCEGGEDGELEMACLEIQGGQWKGGLIVEGIEVRPKRK